MLITKSIIQFVLAKKCLTQHYTALLSRKQNPGLFATLSFNNLLKITVNKLLFFIPRCYMHFTSTIDELK